MNGYKLMADSYRKLAERNGSSEEIERNIKIYDFLSTLDKQDINILFDSGAFNDITKCYCKVAMDNCGIDREIAKNVLNNISELYNYENAENIQNIK